MAVCLYGYVLPTESVSLFFRSRFLFYRGATSSDTWNIVCFILRLHFLKGIAEVSSGVSIGGRPYFRNVPCFLSDRLFFASFPNLLLIFKFCLFHIIFSEVKSFSVANIDCC